VGVGVDVDVDDDGGDDVVEGTVEVVGGPWWGA
jgi:hypothetical protein